jgi:hypothetical protein
MPTYIEWKLLFGRFTPFPFVVNPARPTLHQELRADLSHRLSG